MSPDNQNLKIVPERDEKPPARPVSSPRTQGNGLLWLFVVLLVVAIAAVYYQSVRLSDALILQDSALKKQESVLKQQDNILKQQENMLSQAAARIQLLEDELTATGRNLSQSGNSLTKRIEVSEHEIRKLWDLSNKRNRVDISENQAALEKVRSGMAALTSAQQAQQKVLDDEKEVRQRLSAAQQAEQQKLDQRIRTNNADITVLKQQQLQLVSQINELSQKNEQLSQQLADVDTETIKNVSITLSVYEERLDAIDASRRQLTGNVTRLNTDVNNLQLKVDALAKAGQSQSAAAATSAQ